jgi:hypothetical protein
MGRPEPMVAPDASNFLVSSSIQVFFSLPYAKITVTGCPFAPRAVLPLDAGVTGPLEAGPGGSVDCLPVDGQPRSPRTAAKTTASRRAIAEECRSTM